MLANPFYSQELQGPFQLYDLGPSFTLEEGGTLRGAQLAYATHGRLNKAKDNVILIPTWYSGTSKIFEQAYIGKDRALDPSKYFIIVINQLGNGVSTSPNNTAGTGGRGGFPKIRIGDDVRAQHQLITARFGLKSLALVVGGSMGAQQTYEWAVRYPEMVKRAAAIAGTAKNTEHDFLFGQSLIDAITSDPGWRNGWYESHEEVRAGLIRHAGIWSVMGLCTEFYKQEIWRGLGFSSVPDFMTNFLQTYFCAMDPNALLTMLWKWQRGDVSRHTAGDLKKALGRITAKTFVMPIDEDMFFPPRDCLAEQKMIKGSEYRVLKSVCGHLVLTGFEADFRHQVDAHLKDLLSLRV
ncbi:MAG: alpha/beta fold hydrolase [Gammaproteobacteria bacterium]|nr:alpha/beta fold hydrolase [Gammaproteobacteria bacterium]